MNHSSIVAAVLMLTGLFIAGCQSQESEGLTPADEAAIRQAYETMAKVANAGDAAGWAALYSEDAVLLPPNGPAVQGREAIQKWIDELPPISDTRTELTELEGWGDTAHARGNYSMTIAVPGIAPIAERGKYLEIWKKQADGSWKLARDMFNSDLPPFAPAPPAPSN